MRTRVGRSCRFVVGSLVAAIAATLIAGGVISFSVPAVAQAIEIVSRASGAWSSAGTWSCFCVPTFANRVRILATHAVVLSGDAQAASVVVEGVVAASRTGPSTLTLGGNLVVRGWGWLDYGTTGSPIPAGTAARIGFVLGESRYVGGATMGPLDTDVGLWVVEQGRVTTKGPDGEAGAD